MPEEAVTHYDLLGVEPTASKNEVRAAYQAALDGARGAGDTDHEADVRRAWQVLSDPVQRQRYDERIGVGRRDVPGRRGAPDGAGVETADGADVETTDDADDDDVDVDVEGADDVAVVERFVPGPLPEGQL